jgi:hypothetical protein
MKIDPSKIYNIPLIMGPSHEQRSFKLSYPQIEVLVFQYWTDPGNSGIRRSATSG